MREKVLLNKAKCRLCGDEIVSAHRHDYRGCKCGEITVDGGLDYLRRGAKDLNNIIELSKVIQQPAFEWLAEKLECSKSELKRDFEWGVKMELESAIFREVKDLTLSQWETIKTILKRELVGGDK